MKNKTVNPASKGTEAYSSWLALPPLVVFLGRRSDYKISKWRNQHGERRLLTLVNVGQDTTLGNCDVAEELVQFLVIADGELEVTGDDTCFLVVTSSIASQLEDFGSEVLKDGSKVDGST